MPHPGHAHPDACYKNVPQGRAIGTPRTHDARIATLADSFGLVSATDLYAAGITSSAVSKRVARGQLTRVFHGVYLIGAAEPEHLVRVAAAVRATQPSVATGLTAAELYRASRFGRGPIDIVRAHPNERRCRGVRVRRSSTLEDRDVREVRGIRVASPSRMLIDLAVDLDKFQLCNVMHELEYRRLLNRRELDRVSRRNSSANGIDVVTSAIALHGTGSAGSKSGLEDDVLRRIREAGAPEPIVNRRITLGPDRPELDLYWPDHGVVGDVRGPGHDRLACREVDANLAQIATNAGLDLVPVLWDYVEHGVRKLVATLGERGATIRPGAQLW